MEKKEEKQKPKYPSRERATQLIRGRGLVEYVVGLNLQTSSLDNKTILDIGGGKGNFAREVQDKFGKTRVYNLDPHLEKEGTIKQVAGLAQELPFKNDTFDLIISFFAIPLHIEKSSDEIIFFEEIFRTLKPGGQARIAPFVQTFNHMRSLKSAQINIREIFKESKLEIEMESHDVLVLKKLPVDI